jgi:hypothetical protein
MHRAFFFLVMSLWAAQSSFAANASIDLARAAQCFSEARQLSAADGGRLWGVALYGPMFFVNAETSELVANQADAEGQLTQHGAVWTGRLPPEIGAANTAVKWAGVHWTMIMWPLPADRRERGALMMHECFHRVQEQIGLPARDVVNSQLDTRDGRIWLQLEWRALERALADFDDEGRRAQALGDALQFRLRRWALFPGAAEKEGSLEMNEGLAEYSGWRLANPTLGEFRADAIVILHGGPRRRSFGRSFAYISGPAYGALLDSAPHANSNWRKGLKPKDNFGTLVARAYHLALDGAGDIAAAEARLYDGDEIIDRETERDAKRQAVLAAARARFVDGPLVIFPVVNSLNFGFDPNSVTSIDDNLTLYAPLHLSDDWGVLECEKGAVMVRDAKGMIVRTQVPAPADAAARPLKLDGCTLDLHPGWALARGARTGDVVLKPGP